MADADNDRLLKLWEKSPINRMLTRLERQWGWVERARVARAKQEAMERHAYLVAAIESSRSGAMEFASVAAIVGARVGISPADFDALSPFDQLPYLERVAGETSGNWARNAWMAALKADGVSLKEISQRLADEHPEWEQIESPQGISQAIKSHEKR